VAEKNIIHHPMNFCTVIHIPIIE